jgi:hypothetical protein
MAKAKATAKASKQAPVKKKAKPTATGQPKSKAKTKPKTKTPAKSSAKRATKSAAKPAQKAGAKAKAVAKPRPKIVGGEIVLVPLYDGRYGVTKVLYTSKLSDFRNRVLLGVSNDIVTGIQTPAKLPTKFGKHFYTWTDCIKSGDWPIVAQAEITDEERALTMRIYTDGLWYLDERLRTATREDIAKYETMTTGGSLLAEIEVREHLGLGDPWPEGNPNPMYALAYLRRGKAKAEQGDHKEALEYFKVAIDMDANCRDAYVARAKLHAAMGNAKGAAADEQKVAVLKSK